MCRKQLETLQQAPAGAATETSEQAPTGAASETSQQALSGNPSTVGTQSQGSGESGKAVSFNELVEALDTETGTKTYTTLPAPSTASIDESFLSDIFISAATPFMRAESVAAASMGSSESKVDESNRVQVVESRDGTGKRVSFDVPNVDKP